VPRVALLALAVGLALADSSVVTLGLPDVLGEFRSSPPAVAWVLTGYNLVLALAALPAALIVRRAEPGRVAAAGLIVFAAASLVCALAPSLGVLIAARCVQGLGGAAVACAALVLLEAASGSRIRGAATWGAAGALGAALGPAVGGLLTEGLSWQSIFFLQVPVALACLLALRGAPAPLAEPPGDARPDVRHLAGLAFVGAGLTAALFLLVLMLMAGWRLSPIAAALTVSVMPVAALAGGRLPGGDARVRGATGAVLLGGGLAALGLLPSAHVAWTAVPQVFVGVGLGLAVGALTEAALHGRSPLVVHGGWTLAARHAGVVAALALLSPMFNADLEQQEDRATQSVMARLLDSRLEPGTKLSVGLRLADELYGPTNEVPDVAPAFAGVQARGEDGARLEELEDAIGDELDRAATTAFRRSFLVAALLSLLALVPLLWPAGRGRP
jgi:MFS family permease